MLPTPSMRAALVTLPRYSATALRPPHPGAPLPRPATPRASALWPGASRQLSGPGAAASANGGLPAISRALIEAACPTLWLAPHGESLRHDRPPGLEVLPPDCSRDTLRARIGAVRPHALVVGDHDIDASIIAALRAAALPDGATLVRRGRSLDRIDLAAARQAGVTVINLPGVNAPHVAATAVALLRHPDGTLPRQIAVLGHGDVGALVVRELLAADPLCRLSLLVRRPIGREHLLDAAVADRVTVTHSASAALHHADGVVICVTLTAQTANLIEAGMIDALAPGARVVNLAKPEILHDTAWRALAQRSDVQFTQDYGPATLTRLAQRLVTLGCAAHAWQQPPRLVSLAASGPACHADLDKATGLALAQSAVESLVTRKLATPGFTLALPDTPPPGPRRIVHVLGRGTGLLHAAVLLQYGMKPVIWGERAGTSFTGDMRHLNVAETLALPGSNPHLDARADAFLIALNRCGLALWQRFLADNPDLRAHVPGERLVRVWPAGTAENAAAVLRFRDLAEQPWPGDPADHDRGAPLLGAAAGARRTGLSHVGPAHVTTGYVVALRGFLAALEARLQQAGASIIDGTLDETQIARLRATPGTALVRATGLAMPGLAPTLGWLVTLRAHGKELAGSDGVKLMLADSDLGTLNCRRRADGMLEISGGVVGLDAGPRHQEQVRQRLLDSIAAYFPASWAASDNGPLQITPCVRASTSDGIPVIEHASAGEVVTGAAHKGGFTQALAHALVAAELLANENSVGLSPSPA